MVVGRLLPFCNGSFLGDMLVFRCIQHTASDHWLRALIMTFQLKWRSDRVFCLCQKWTLKICFKDSVWSFAVLQRYVLWILCILFLGNRRVSRVSLSIWWKHVLCCLKLGYNCERSKASRGLGSAPPFHETHIFHHFPTVCTRGAPTSYKWSYNPL